MTQHIHVVLSRIDIRTLYHTDCTDTVWITFCQSVKVNAIAPCVAFVGQ